VAFLPHTLEGLAFHIGFLEAYLKRLRVSRPFTSTSEQFESRRGVSHRLLKKEGILDLNYISSRLYNYKTEGLY